MSRPLLPAEVTSSTPASPAAWTVGVQSLVASGPLRERLMIRAPLGAA